MKKFTKEHRDIIEAAALENSGRVVVEWKGEDFCKLTCKQTGELITCAWIEPIDHEKSSKAAMICILADLMRWAGRFSVQKAVDKEIAKD